MRQSTRVPTRIALTVVSLNPFVNFSESCTTVSVNAQGCALYCEKSIAVSTPVLLRLQNGQEAGGQVAFCKGSPSNEKLWGIGIVLDKPGNFWGLNPCPKDWLSSEEKTDASPSGKASAGLTPEQIEGIRAEFREQLRLDVAALVSEARTNLEQEANAQNENIARLEKLLQESTKAEKSLSAMLASLQPSLDQKIADGTKEAIEQIESRIAVLSTKAESDLEEHVAQIRQKSEEVDSRIQSGISSELKQAKSQLSELVEEKKQEITEATEPLGDRIYSSAQQRLEQDFARQQEAVTSRHKGITDDIASFREEFENVDKRITKLRALSSELEATFGHRLNQSVSEATEQARGNFERVLHDIRDEQIGKSRDEMENLLASISSRADSSIKDLHDYLEAVTREREETQAQLASMRQTREETELWLSSQLPGFKENIDKIMSDAKAQTRAVVQNAIKVVEDPLEKLSREAKHKIEEFTTAQYAELNEGIHRLRNLLATFEQQAEDSLREAFQANCEASSQDSRLPEDAQQENVKTNERSQNTFAKKLSGLVRGRESRS